MYPVDSIIRFTWGIPCIPQGFQSKLCPPRPYNLAIIYHLTNLDFITILYHAKFSMKVQLYNNSILITILTIMLKTSSFQNQNQVPIDYSRATTCSNHHDNMKTISKNMEKHKPVINNEKPQHIIQNPKLYHNYSIKTIHKICP